MSGKAIEVTKAFFQGLLSKRKRFTNKGDYGRAIIIGGSYSYSGAPLLAYQALLSLSAGAGRAYCYVPAPLYKMLVGQAPQVILRMFPATEDGSIRYDKEVLQTICDQAETIALGMGVGPAKDLPLIIHDLAQRSGLTLILDADALNALALAKMSPLADHQAQVILTPHVGEFARLASLSIEVIKKDPEKHAREFALRHHCFVLLKDAWTIATDGNTAYLFTGGNAGLAKAGSGDLLAGFLAGLFAQKIFQEDPLKTMILASYILGSAAEIAVKKKSEYSLLSNDIIDAVGGVMKELT